MLNVPYKGGGPRTGLPGYEVSGWYGILAPARTPKGVIDTLNKATRTVFNQAEMEGKLLALGIDTVDSNPEQFGQFLHADIQKWDKVIKTLKIEME